jgi:hypothetical protein
MIATEILSGLINSHAAKEKFTAFIPIAHDHLAIMTPLFMQGAKYEIKNRYAVWLYWNPVFIYIFIAG